MSRVLPFARKTAVAIAVIGVVGLCAARKASFRNEAFAESPKLCGDHVGPIFRPGGRMGFHTLRLESSQQLNENTKRLRFQLPDPASNAGLCLACKLPCTSTDDQWKQRLMSVLAFILTFHKPKDAWFPVIRPYTPINNFGKTLESNLRENQ